MLKNSTINNLKTLAQTMVNSFKLEHEHNLISTQEIDDVVKNTKHKSKLEIVKTMIKHDYRKYKNHYNLKALTNIMKTTEQFDFLALEIWTGIKKYNRSLIKNNNNNDIVKYLINK